MYCQKILLGSVLIFANALWAICQEPISPLLSSFPAYQQHKRETTFNLDWISLGPTFNSARADAIQLDPTHPGTMYVGFGSGNLWKTTNNGLAWKPIFEDQPSTGIGDFALAPSNPNIIYLGTGENLKKPRNFTMPGTGVYRSDDGGISWRHLGLNDSWHIGEIKVHPTNPDIVFVAVLGHLWSTNKNRGIYRSINGGKTWQHVLYIDEKTGGNDIVISPSNPNIVYASMWEVYPGISGVNSGVYKSIDGGKTWKKMNQGLPSGKGNGRIGIAVSYTNPNKVYILMDNLNNDKNKAAEIYKSLNGGNTWAKTHRDSLMIFPGIGWYFTDIYVNPKNDEEIYGMGVRIAHSVDGGKNFDLVAGNIFHMTASTADILHLDQTEMWINPKNPNHMAIGNDGGFYVSYDKGANWMHYNNIPVGEFYDVTTSSGNPYMVYGGTQDDATTYGPAEEWNSRFPDKWKYVWLDPWCGGDGCITQVDPTDPNTVYWSYQHGVIMRKDMTTDRSKSIKPTLPKPINDELNYNYITPYFISPHNPLTLYHAGNYVFKSIDRGDHWDIISPNLSISSNPEKKSFAAGAIAESPIKSGVLFMGTDKGAVWVTLNNGLSWEERSVGLPNNYIRSIYPSKFSASRVYITLTGINYDDLNTYVYVSEDYGQNWKPINSNLPNEIANTIMEDPMFEDILYVGTFRGVYISTNRGISWSLLGSNMTATAISDIEIQRDAMDMVIATHGRGIYKMNLQPIHEAFMMASSKNDNQLFSIPTATLPWFNGGEGTGIDPNLREGEKIVFSFNVQEASKVMLKVTNETNQILWSETINAHKGINQYRWDLVTKRVESLLPYFIEYRQYMKSGTYNLILEVNGEQLKKTFEITDRKVKD